MKILVIQWNALTYKYIYKALHNLQIEIEILIEESVSLRTQNQENREDLIKKICKKIKEGKFSVVFSINYFASVSEACKRIGVLYISWAYDTPAIGEDVKTHYYETNRIFLFDSGEVEVCKSRGIKNVWKCDLAVNIEDMEYYIKEGRKKDYYSSEISFVGRLYNTIAAKAFSKLSEYSVGYFNALINTQMNIHEKDLIADILSDELVEYLITPDFEAEIQEFNKEMVVQTQKIKEPIVRMLLQQTVTNRERKIILSALAQHHEVKLFTTDEKDELMSKVIFCKNVDYYIEMPLVFRNSKINLNITARNIPKGIPQRCLDIMACKGLLLTNYQEDLFDYFVENHDLIIYRNVVDAVEKANYYLLHEDQAEKIRYNGYLKTKELFSYEKQLMKILDLSGIKWR